MLVLGRHSGQSIRIGEDVVVHIVRVDGGQVRVGVEAPRAIPVVRTEIDHGNPRDKTAPPRAA
jgi:carbon storage regulator